MAAKRPAATLAAKGAKKQKGVDPVAQQCQDVLVGLRKAGFVDTALIDMMCDGVLRLALTATKSTRHKFQDGVVEMAEHALVGSEGALKEAIQAATEAVAGAKEALAAAEQQGAAKETAMTDASAVTKERKNALAAIAKRYGAAKTALAEAQAAEKAGNKELSQAEGKKGALLALVGKHLGPLKEGTSEEGQTAELVMEFLGGLKEVGFDASLLVALPNVLGKAPSARSPFDTVVITQLEDEIAKRVAAHDAVLNAGEGGKAARAAAVKAAEDHLADCTKQQEAAAEAYLAADAVEKEAQAAFQEAEAGVKGAAATVRKLEKELATADKKLQGFRAGPLAAFLSLRDREEPAEAADVGMEVEAAPEAAAPDQ